MSNVITRKYKNNVKSTSKMYGKTYGRVLHTETLTTDEFAEHISTHGSPFTRSVINGVLMAACDCLVELCLDSKKVRLGDLGTFYLSAATTGAESAEAFTANNVKRLHLRFLPNMRRSYRLDSNTLRKKASLTSIEELLNSTGGTSGTNSGGSSTPVVEQPE